MPHTPKQNIKKASAAKKSKLASQDKSTGKKIPHMLFTGVSKTSRSPLSELSREKAAELTETKYETEPISEEEHKAWLVDTLKKCIETEMIISGFGRNLLRNPEVIKKVANINKIEELSKMYDQNLKTLFKNIKLFFQNPSKAHKDAMVKELMICTDKRDLLIKIIEAYIKAFPKPEGTKLDAKIREAFGNSESAPTPIIKPFLNDFPYMETLIAYAKIIIK